MLLSIGYFFFIPPQKIPKASPTHPIMGSIQTGMNGLISTASTINELLELNSLIESMALKDSLNNQDSLFLIEILDKMQIIEKSLAIKNRKTIIHDK